MTMFVVESAISSAIIGVALHLGYFIRGEHTLNAPSILLAYIVGPPLLTAFLTLYIGTTWFQSLRIVTILLGSFTGALTTSILVYRLLFHPLRSYHGPVGARVSKLWHASKNLQGEMSYRLFDRLHKQYGDYVRTGPNELSIIDSDIIDAVYSGQSKCIKTQWYDLGLPLTTVHQMRDRGLHDRRRRQGWDKAFSSKALREYDSRIIGFADKLTQQLSSMSDRPVNATKWFSFYGYDIMGSLGFGRSFATLDTGKSHFAIDIMEQGQGVFQFFAGVPWLVRIIIQAVPSSVNPITKLLRYSDDCVMQRKGTERDSSDIISHLIEGENFFGDAELDHLLLTGDSRLVIIAGSDTTSAALAYTFFYVAQDKSVVEKLRSELAEIGVRDDDTFSVPALQNLSYMNGVINEALRLHPPVPAGVFRQTPPEGLQVGNHYIPGNVNLITPHYSLHRSPRNFKNPDDFLPERWTTRPELILNKEAFFPFTTGPYGCIGKHLAMNEMRTVIAKLVLNFDVSLAPGESGFDLLEKDRDMFTIKPGDLHLCFEKRDLSNKS